MADPTRKQFEFQLNIEGTDEEVLVNSPDGWLQTKINYKRSSVYKGLIRSLTFPMKFVLKGATLLRNEFYQYGVLSRVNVLINKLNNRTWGYDKLFLGKLDFTNFLDENTGVTINAIEKDFSVQLAAYEDVDYEIPLEGSDIIEVTLPAQRLNETADFIFLPTTDFRSNCFFPTQLVQNNQVATEASVQANGFLADDDVNFSTAYSWFIRPRTNTNIRIYGHIEGFVFSFDNPKEYEINVYNQNGTILKHLLNVTVVSDPVAFNIDFDFVVNANAGDRLFFYFDRVNADENDTGFNIVKGDYSLEYKTVSPDSKCQAIRIFDLTKRLLKLMNTTSPSEPNQPVPFTSYLLTNTFKNLVYTCSDSIRSTYINEDGSIQTNTVGALYQAGDTLQIGGRYLVLGGEITYRGITYPVNSFFNYALGYTSFTTIEDGFVRQVSSTPSIVINFQDLFQDVIALQCGQAAFGIENGIAFIEDLSYVYRNTSGALTLQNTKAPSLVPAIDLMANSFEVGYKDQQYDTINGNDEVNSTQTYVTDLLTANKKLNFVATSRADPKGIEITRVTPVDTSSSRSDNDRFMIVIKETPEIDGSYKPVQMDALSSFTGVDDTYYNWFITPKQNLLRGAAYLHSIFDKMDGYFIKQSSALKNKNLVTVQTDGTRVAEADNVAVSSLAPPLFLPYYVSVVPGFLQSPLDIISNTPYGIVSFKMNGSDFKGFIEDITTDEGKNTAQEFKLLLGPENDTTLLIH